MKRPLWTKMYKSAFLYVSMLLGAGSAYGQGAHHEGTVINQNGRPTKASITVCFKQSSGVPCTPKVPAIYSDEALTVVKANPFNTDAVGNFDFWAAPGNYSYTIVGTGVTSFGPVPLTIPCVPNAPNCGGGGGGGGAPAAPQNSLQKNNGLGGLAAAGIIDNGTNIALSEPIIAPNGGTLNGAFAGSPLFSLTGNEAIKPASAEPIQYVSANGNDANDGLSWGSAKLTVYTALQSLPGGSSTTAGSGTVFLSGTVNYGGPIGSGGAGGAGGMWIMGTTDPNFGSPPTGWLKYSGPVSIECLHKSSNQQNGRTPVCVMNGGGAQSATSPDFVHPAFWFSGFAGGFQIKDVRFENYKMTYGKIGIDSNNNRNGLGGVSSIRIEGAAWNLWNTGATTLACGPGIDIGANTFWVTLDYITANGCPRGVLTIAPTGLSRTAGVVTVTTTTANIIATAINGATQWVTIQGATDSSFNGSYIVASVIDSTHFTYNQFIPGGSNAAAPDATSGNGQVVTANAANINIDSGTGPTTGTGLIYVENYNFNGGGLRAVNGSYADIRNGTFEGDFVNPTMPPVLSIGSTVVVDNLEVADTVGTAPPVQIDGGQGGSVVSNVRFGVSGNAVLLGGTSVLTPAGATPRSPLHSGQAGIFGSAPAVSGLANAGTFLYGGGMDQGRRIFPPVSVISPNLASTNPAVWTVYQSGPATITTSIADPVGGTNAGRVAGTSSSQAFAVFYKLSNTVLTAGDVYVWGVWARSQTANGYSQSNPPVTFILTADGFGVGDNCTADSSIRPLWSPPSTWSDGQWVWLAGFCKIYQNPSNASVMLAGVVDNTHTMDFFSPVVMKFASGTKSDNEIFEIVNNLPAFPDTASTGDVTMLRGQRFSMSTPGNNFFIKHLGTLTADRNVTWPDISFTVPATSLAQTWTANQSFSNGTELRFFSSNATNYAGFKGGASTSNLIWLFPTADSSGTQCLSSNGSLQLAWSACSAGTGTPGGANTNIQYQAGGVFAGSGNFTFNGTDTLGLGLLNTTKGIFKQFGNTSGTVTIQPQAVAGTPTITWPTASGTVGTTATSPVTLDATTGAIGCATCMTAGATLTANQLLIGGGTSVVNPLGTLGTTTTLLHGNAAGAPTYAAVALATEVSGTLPIANGGTNGTTATAAFDNLAPTTTRGDLIVRGASNNVRLALGGNGTCVTSNGTDALWGSCAAGAISGTAVSGQGTFWNGTATVGGSSNWLYAAGSGHSVIQGANNVDAFYMKRFTDSAPTGNFLHFQNAAANADLFKVDASGNGTMQTLTLAGAGAGGLQMNQGAAPALVANAINLAAPASVAASGENFIFPGTPSSGFIRWANSSGTLSGSFSAASGIGGCTNQVVQAVNDNAAPTCISLLPSNFQSQSANFFLAAPNGSAGVPTFRAVALGDLPAIQLNSTAPGGVANTLGIANGGTSGTTATAAFDALSPTTTQGDISYRNATNNVRLAPGTATQLLHSGTTPSWSAVSLTADVTGVTPLANGGTNASSGLANTNGAVYSDGTKLVSTATGGAGTLCLISVSGGTPVFGSCAGSASTVWSALTDPAAALSLSMGVNKSTFTSGVLTGTNGAWSFLDGNSSSTGKFFEIHTGASSTAIPFTVTALGTANGVQVDATGSFGVIGTGNNTANKLSRTITTTTPLTIGGGSSADLTADRTLACATCVTSSAALTSNQVVIGSGGGQGTATKSFADLTVNDYVAGGGTAQAQTATLSPAASALTAGLVVAWLPTAANSGAAPTLAVNGLTAKNITKLGTAALVANDLTTTAVAVAIYDGTQFQLQNPQTSSASGTTIQVGGASVNATANLNSTTPALPTSVQGSSAAPAVLVGGAIPVTFQKDASGTTGITAYTSGFVPLPNYRVTRLCLANGSGTAANPIFCDLGDKIQVINTITTLTNVASTSTVPPLAKMITGSATTVVGYQSATAVGFFTGTNLLYQAGVKLDDWNATPATWNERIMFGLGSTGIVTGASDTPSGYGGFFRASSNVPDTNYQCMVANNAAATATDSGVAVDNSFHRFQIFFNDSTAHVLFYIDNVQKCDVSSGVPATGNSMRRFVSVQPLTATSKGVNVAWDMVQGDQ